MKVVPIIHCFDYNYVLPAGVAFQSLLEHAKMPDTLYAIHVIGTDLTDDDKKLLQGIVSRFGNATIEFIKPPKLDMPDFCSKGCFTKDIFYKLLIPELFPQYDKVLVSDVDVVYARDIALLYDEMRDDEDSYVFGTEDIGYATWRNRGILRDMGAPKFFERYKKEMSKEELDKLYVGVGLFGMNLRLFRQDRMSTSCIEFAKNNMNRVLLPEQDVINICCHPKIKLVGSHYMAIAEFEPYYKRLTNEEREANPSWDEMFANPVQIHYAAGIKPWKYPQCPYSRQWFESLFAAGLFDSWRGWYERFMAPYVRMTIGKRLLDITIPLHKNKQLHVRIHKENVYL